MINTVGPERAPELSFKTALALALILARMVGGLAALSVNPCCQKAGVSTAEVFPDSLLGGICLVVL